MMRSQGNSRRCLAVFTLATAVCLRAAGADPPPQDGGAPPHEVRIQLRPRRVHCGSLVLLTARSDPDCEEEHEVRWKTNAGVLHFDDLSEIAWRAPARTGTCTLAVEVDCRGRTVRAEVSVEVHAPSTEGMVRIPAGRFLRGDVEGTNDPGEVKTAQNANDEPAHEVYLDSYWIDRHQVTHEEYASFLQEATEQGLVRPGDLAVMGEIDGTWVPFYYFQHYTRFLREHYETRSRRKPRSLHAISWDGERFRVKAGCERLPAVDVSWFGAEAYARFHGKALPTDAQWEKAARGTDGRRYPWGWEMPSAYHLSLTDKLQPVGIYSPLGDSPYGIADAVSSCSEWTADWFDRDYYLDQLPVTPGGSPLKDPEGPYWGRAHSIRGFPTMRRDDMPTVERPTPLTLRYNWFFEYLLGDSFADGFTTFRTSIPPRREQAASGATADGEQAARKFHSRGLAGAGACKECHPRQHLEWRGSAHAYAMVDPVFRACNRMALEDTCGEIGTSCLECHSPIGVRSGELRGDFRVEDLSPPVRDGVSCEVCHRMEPPREAGPVANAAFELSEGAVFFGRLHEPAPADAHESARSELIGSSDHCGSCHDVIHRGRRIEKTFAEWEASVYPARESQCQDCHMPRYSGQAAVGGPFRETLRRHDFPGVFTPLVPFPNGGYQEEEQRKFLRTAARLSVEIPDAFAAGSEVVLNVSVKNSGVGHNFPAASVRQLWLEVTVVGGGEQLFSSGLRDSNGDLRDGRSELDPTSDPWLTQFSDYFVDVDGKPVPYWRSERTVERSLAPLEERRVGYRFTVPRELAGGTARVRVRLLFRSLAPHHLRKLGLGDLAPLLPVWELAAEDSGPLPVLVELPRPTLYRVPRDFATIQEALDALRDGDEVTVAPGTYEVERPIDFGGKSVRVRSAGGSQRTVIRYAAGVPDGERGSVVVFHSGEGPGALLEGFTLEGGRGTLVRGLRRGGGVSILRSSPTLSGNRVVRCGAAGGAGGGIACEDGAPVIAGNEVLACWAERGGGIAVVGHGIAVPSLGRDSVQGCLARRGGGIHVDPGLRVRIERCVLAGNIALEEGGGAFVAGDARLEVTHCTLVHNRAGRSGGAVHAGGGAAFVEGSILWSNAPELLGASVEWSIAQERTACSPTCRDAFPLFVDPAGAWDPEPSSCRDPGGVFPRELWPSWWHGFMRWIGGDYALLHDSPAIDAGDPAARTDPDDTLADLGAVFHEQPLRGFVRGDADGDGTVCWDDLLVLARRLESGESLPCEDAADVDDGGTVTPADAVRLAKFLATGEGLPAPPFPACGLDPTFGEGLPCTVEPAPCRRDGWLDASALTRGQR